MRRSNSTVVMAVAAMTMMIAGVPASAGEDEPQAFSSTESQSTTMVAQAPIAGQRMIALPDGGVALMNNHQGLYLLDQDGASRLHDPVPDLHRGIVAADGALLWVFQDDYPGGTLHAYDLASATKAFEVTTDGCSISALANLDGETYATGFCNAVVTGFVWRVTPDGLVELRLDRPMVETPERMGSGPDALVVFAWARDWSRISIDGDRATVVNGSTQEAVEDHVVLSDGDIAVTFNEQPEGLYRYDRDLRDPVLIDERAGNVVDRSPDGRYVTYSDGRSTVVWDATLGRRVAAFIEQSPQSPSGLSAISDTRLWIQYDFRDRVELHRVDLDPPPAVLSIVVSDAYPEEDELVSMVGRLTRADGTPIDGWTVHATEHDSTPESFAMTTNRDGVFEVTIRVEDAPNPYDYTFAAEGSRGFGQTNTTVRLDPGFRWSDFAYALPVGDDPVEYGVAFSQARFPDSSAGLAVLSRDDVFADALAGAPLAAHGPLLFTPSGHLDARVADELARVLPVGGEVILLGGPSALTPSVAASIEDLGYRVTRLFGTDRIGTALEVASRVRAEFGVSDVVAVARSHGPGTAAWADAVTGGAWANAYGVPIVVTPTGGLDSRVATALEDWAPEVAVLFGGESALSGAVERSVADAARPRDGNEPVVRVAGDNRAGTALDIARRLFVEDPTTTVVIEGFRSDGWAYGLAAAGFAGDVGAPVLLSYENNPTAELTAWLCDSTFGTKAQDVYVVGGDDTLIASWIVREIDDRSTC